MKSGKRNPIRLMAFVLMALATAIATAADAGPGRSPVKRYIVELMDAPLAAYAGGEVTQSTEKSGDRLQATSPGITGARRLDVRSPRSRAYLEYLDGVHRTFRDEARALLKRGVDPVHSYRNALNGMVLDLTPAEAARLAESPMVRSVKPDSRHRLETDAGPEWIGANALWNGQAGFPATRGEGIVIGVIDSGVNWEHPSFADPANDGFDHTNPFGSQLGLCSQPEVPCNDKLIGVYDFVEDDPETDDVVEENNNGRDNNGHGSHVTAIAAGNELNVAITFEGGTINTTLSGVAPHANIVMYRVCFIGDPPDPDGGGCLGSAILAAIDQAIADGVDIINYSIGTDAFSPWESGSIPRAFLNARNAGIVVVTSGGNEGPNAGTVGSPANAPWILAVGNATHNRVFGSLVRNLSGGANPPDDLVGASLTGGIGTRQIVHAKEFGFPLCGTGPAELQATCGANLGQSNPWQGQTPFNGQIVVCDRGIYGRVEKGKNVMLAGAGGYILANTEEFGESIVADEHCLPATHIGDQDGDALRAWLDSGGNHQGSLSGFTLAEQDRFADQLNASSSRGPVAPPVEDTLKPNLIAPGTTILSASNVAQEFLVLTGTSMSSPHIAGSAALLRAVNPSWSPAQVASALELTATAELATDIDGSPATPHQRGAGRPRLGDAANAGFYLDVTGTQFTNANPAIGGSPRNLNLSALVHSDCQGSCSFARTVTDQMGGGSWSAVPEGFPPGVQVTINPANFTLSNGGSQTLQVTVNLAPSGIVGEWIYGDIRFTAAGSPDLAMTAAVFASGGDLPAQWAINDNRGSGWKEFSLAGLAAMPDATFVSGGLVAPTRTVKTVVQDPTAADPVAEKGRFPSLQNHDPFDGGAGVFTVWHNLAAGGLWLHAETLASTAQDLDLFVGRDDNGNDTADAEEQLCASTSPIDIEECNLFNLPAGRYWIVVQNWAGTNAGGDQATLLSAAIDGSDTSRLVAGGPGIVGAAQSFDVRLSWSDIEALPGQQWLGAVGIGTRRDTPNNIGVIPVRFNRSGISAPQTLPLMNGVQHRLALAGNSTHNRIFIDIPPGVTDLVIAAQGANAAQNNALSIELFRQDFGAALASAPVAQLPGGLPSIISASGSGGAGPSIAINDTVTPGRYFVRVGNNAAQPAAVRITATTQSTESTFDRKGLWGFTRSPDISQGAEWNSQGAFDFSLWFTYDDEGQPTWFIASAPAQAGNIWIGDLFRVTNDGMNQQEHQVGKLALTFLSDTEAIFTYAFHGQAGFDPMVHFGPNTCPMIGGGEKSYTGAWFRGISGLGGASVVVWESAQAQVHYLFDAKGDPRWLITDDAPNPTAEVIPLLQFKGFCAVCAPTPVTSQEVGTLTRTFTSETSGSWTLDFQLLPPLTQNLDRTDSIVKLSDTLPCQ